MDFSNAERALQSLQRRTPALPQAVTDVAKQDLAPYFEALEKGSEILNVDVLQSQVMPGIMTMLQDTEARWESLAVGLFLSMTLLEQFAKSITPSDEAASSHYVDGPRLPSLTNQPTAAADTNTSLKDPPLPSLETIVYFCSKVVLQTCQEHLEHSEPRVRTLVARTIGAHARLTTLIVKHGTEKFVDRDDHDFVKTLHEQVSQIYEVIQSSLVEQYKYKRADVGIPDTTNLTSSEAAKRTMVALDDTTGWRALETSLHALASWLDGYSSLYWSSAEGSSALCFCELLIELHTVNKDDVEEMSLLQMIEECCTKHINRHVRAAALQTMDQLVTSASTAALGGKKMAYQALYDSLPAVAFLRRAVVNVLVVTLADNWSQVRMAASVLCRSLLKTMLEEQDRQKANEVEEGSSVYAVLQTQVFPKLLPRMCLNRFYMAQGVKLYSQETWEMVFATQDGNTSLGADMVARHSGAVARYYAKMADADNHVVREAACQAIAELAQKIGSDEQYSHLLEPHVPVLLQALIMCFFDESWPVRDEASLACGTFARAYPEVCRPELPSLMERWIEQLTDQIWSVREDAGIALGDAILAYGKPTLDTIVTKLNELIPSARKQPAESREQMLAKHNDPEVHTDNQLYSCGSLAPKLGRGSARATGGCSDCKMSRDRMPWEATDGCIYMVRELFKLSTGAGADLISDDLLKSIFSQLIDVCRVKHFPQADDLRATLFRQVPEMARAVGKLKWKRLYLDTAGFLDLMIDTLQDRGGETSQLAVHAAGSCATEMANLVGKGILVGRVLDELQQTFLQEYLASQSSLPHGHGMMHHPPGLMGGGAMGGAMPFGMGPPAPTPGRVPW